MRVLLATLLAIAIPVSTLGQPVIRFYVGSLRPGPAAPISTCTLDPATGIISLIDTMSLLQGPGYLALAPATRSLYAVTQSNEVVALAIDTQGRLTIRNRQPVGAVNPCHLSVAPSGQAVFTTTYTGGTVAVFPLQPDGQLSPASQQLQLAGTGPHPTRQDRSHAHCVVASGESVFVTDLGADRIMNYRFHATSATLVPNPGQAAFSGVAGAGPRHLVVHPNGRRAFLLNELSGTLVSLRISRHGVLSAVQTVSTLPVSFTQPNTAAAVRLHPNGQFVYVSNRGFDGITAFRIRAGGTLKQVDQQQQGIHMPRDFAIDPSGRFMLVGNMQTDELVVYAVNPRTGRLRFRRVQAGFARPTCLVFEPR
ncbi:lactonase family protein [Spirosoma luteolum]